MNRLLAIILGLLLSAAVISQVNNSGVTGVPGLPTAISGTPTDQSALVYNAASKQWRDTQIGSLGSAYGTVFTVSGCGSATSISGDATGGKFTCGTGAAPATITVTVNGATGSTAGHLWVCSGSDTTTAVALPQSGTSSTTTCTMKGTIATNDVVTFNISPH